MLRDMDTVFAGHAAQLAHTYQSLSQRYQARSDDSEEQAKSIADDTERVVNALGDLIRYQNTLFKYHGGKQPRYKVSPAAKADVEAVPPTTEHLSSELIATKEAAIAMLQSPRGVGDSYVAGVEQERAVTAFHDECRQHVSALLDGFKATADLARRTCSPSMRKETYYGLVERTFIMEDSGRQGDHGI